MDGVMKGLVIVLDGCRPDGLAQADTPHIDALWQGGAYSWTARTVSPSVTLPPHCSMFFGTEPETHGVESNEWPEGYVYVIPSLFALYKQQGLKTAMVHTWEPLVPIAAPGTLDICEYKEDWRDGEVTTGMLAATVLQEESPDLMFVHLPYPDLGHELGWMTESYLRTIARSDDELGLVMEALRGMEIEDETVIVVLADHGGHDTTHGSELSEDMTIPWIIRGPGIRAGHQIGSQVMIQDTAPTMAAAVGLPIPASWTGRVIEEVFGA